MVVIIPGEHYNHFNFELHAKQGKISLATNMLTVAKGYPHHVTQRGNYRQAIFETDEDFIQYLKWLKVYSRKYGLNK